jgi:hypothetical protein
MLPLFTCSFCGRYFLPFYITPPLTLWNFSSNDDQSYPPPSSLSNRSFNKIPKTPLKIAQVTSDNNPANTITDSVLINSPVGNLGNGEINSNSSNILNRGGNPYPDYSNTPNYGGGADYYGTPRGNSTRSNQSVSARLEINLSGGEGGLQLEGASVKVDYVTSSNRQREKTEDSSTSTKNFIGGFTLNYNRRVDKPFDPNDRIEGKTPNGKGAVRADEGKDALHFKFKTPLPETAVIMTVKVAKGGQAATVKYDRDGNLETKGDVFVKTATLSSEAPE